MIEYAIQHDLDLIAVRHVQKSKEVCHRTQLGINFVIAGGVVPVSGWREENWIQVDGIDAQILQVLNAVNDATKIAALEQVNGRWSTPTLYVGRIILFLAIFKSIWKNLVKNTVLDPGGYCHEDSLSVSIV